MIYFLLELKTTKALDLRAFVNVYRGDDYMPSLYSAISVNFQTAILPGFFLSSALSAEA
jgi:hypothetical protein